MGNKFLGIVDIAVDGTTLLSGDSATLEPGGVSRTVVKGSKVFGYREEVMESKIECAIAIDSDFSIDALRNLTGVTATFTCDTGQVWTIGGAWCSEPPSVSQKDGTAKLVLMGPPATEIL